MSAAALLANDALRASRDQMTMANAAASHKHAATSVTLSINSLSSNLLCVVEFRPNGGDWCQAESWSTEREANEACAIHRRYQGGPVSWRVRKR